MIRPGEFSLAHGGVLLADELPEWPRDSRESLREPLERGKVTITRSRASFELPADFTLVANGNLCPCGGWPRLYPRLGSRWRPSAAKAAPCFCDDGSVRNYLKRISGPILDRIDIVQLVLPGESTANPDRLHRMRDRVAEAHQLSVSLWGCSAGELSGATLEHLLRDHPSWKKCLDARRPLSLRARHKVTRVALSLAIHEHLDGRTRSPEPDEVHFEEAFYQRPEGLNLFGTTLTG